MTQENAQETYFGLPSFWFQRPDSESDDVFYEQARIVAHIDDATMDAITDFYREFIPAGASVLDLMSSWLSHLPNDLVLRRVAGLGMNAEELSANPQLTEWCVHNLNESPQLPFNDGSFDRALIVVSIQYLTQPVEVLQSVLSSLKPGGAIAIAMSHRLFPTKAIAAFQGMERDDKMKLVGYCLQQAGFGDITFHDRSPLGADPMWIMTATKPMA
jgi:SAM-dependent methyltransferase